MTGSNGTEATLDALIKKLRREESGYLATINAQKAEIRRLRAGIRALVPTESDEEAREPDAIPVQAGNDTEVEHEETSAEKPQITWDMEDRVFRCGGCQWEVVDGECQQCGKVYELDLASAENNENPSIKENVHGSVCIDEEGLHPDRRVAPRGTTPLLEIPPNFAGEIPHIYAHTRIAEYEALLARGATREMCITFRLSFDYATGITARLCKGDRLWTEFSGPAMAAHDAWVVCLGRRIVLEPNDLDGSKFLEELLEEAVLFPVCSKWETEQQKEWIWTTTKEGNIWTTKPLMDSPLAEIPESTSEAGSDDSAHPLTLYKIYDKMLKAPPESLKGDGIIRRDDYEATDYESSDEEAQTDVEMRDETQGEVTRVERESSDEEEDFHLPDRVWEGESEESEEPSDFFDTSDDEAAITA
ncbi:hypothetical protein BOTBODRAFT_57206 [Botryobasidium botryosum FD-172 SS1]|uniref:DUF8191 domain-containing protein n=1 Tax=Botryobasidium botryosum (strain FD-172 SS1) TaxID=930990 RepID=A0A067MJS1_BOTB1|nr:hypothetical protein BOTBODRAFT_57206 [Botryobasidium botryosum FD-172 SS1]